MAEPRPVGPAALTSEGRLAFLASSSDAGWERVVYISGRRISLDQEFWGDKMLREMREARREREAEIVSSGLRKVIAELAHG